MRKFPIYAVIPTAILPMLVLCSTGVADEPEFDRQWPSWRGPLSDGVAPHANPPVEWSETKNVKWKVPVPGNGSATPIVWGNSIFVLTAIPTEREKEAGGALQQRRRRGGFNRGEPPTNYYQFAVLCYDRETGRELWRKVATEQVPHEPGHPTNTFASGSPTTDGQRLFVSFGSYGVFCYDLDGNRKWNVDLGDMKTRNGFGEGSSPMIYKDTLVVPWDHEGQSYLFALDANTGETRWKIERDEVTTWNTPLITEYDGVVQVVINGTRRACSYNLADGELIWECGGQATNPIPSPIRYKDTAICMTGYRGYAIYAIPLSSRGDLTGSDRIVWKRTDIGPYIASPVLYKDRLYVTKSRDATLTSIDPENGKTVIEPMRLRGMNVLYASPVAAAGRLYYTDRNGTTTVLQAGDQLKVLAVNELDEGIDASPVPVGDELILRSSGHLYCMKAE